ncbi:endonuclease/exonuclease/phosphatase family protein [Pedobacter sp.]
MKNLMIFFGMILWAGIACKSNTDEIISTEKQAAVSDGPTIKVMSYNIHLANPPSQPASVRDLQAIANVINAQKPDLVALQEVDVNTQRSGINVNQAMELAKLTNMYYFYTKAIDFQGGQYGDAVLSRFPILESIRHELPVTQTLGGETRSVAMVRVEKDGYQFFFASTHLDHLGADDNRILQAQSLNNIVKGLSHPLIIAGDLNATPTSKPIITLQQELQFACTSSCPFTFPATSPTRTIDYVMLRPYNKFYIKNYQTVNQTYASDHLPIVAEIVLK